MAEPKPRNAYEIVLPGKRKVVFVELKTGEMKMALQLASKERAEAARNFVAGIEGLKLSIREVDGRKVGYDDFKGDAWDDMFSARETNLLVRAWNKVHSPTDEEAEEVEGGLTAVSG